MKKVSLQQVAGLGGGFWVSNLVLSNHLSWRPIRPGDSGPLNLIISIISIGPINAIIAYGR